MSAMAPFVADLAGRAAPGKPVTILDLGAGVGRFSVPLADRFGADVLAVEPSEKMRSQGPPHPRVRYVAGSAQAIPCPEAGCDAVFLSMVIHHISDPFAAAREIARVLRPGGYAFVRNAFRGRFAGICMYRYFPKAREADEARLPTLEQTDAWFAAAGLPRVAHHAVPQQIDASLAEHCQRLKLKSLSSLAFLSEEELRAGFAALEADVAAEAVPTPVIEAFDLLVYQRKVNS